MVESARPRAPEPASPVAGQIVLVLGATGTLGLPVVRRLVHDGYRVRALSRSAERARSILGPSVEVFEGDVGDRNALVPALTGADAVHLSLQAEPRREEEVEHLGTAHVAELAGGLGVARISLVSGMYAGLPEARAPAERAKARAELALQRSGVAYTVFRPTYFMETLERHLQGGRAIVLGRQPHRLRMIAAADFAAQVSTALRLPAAANRTFSVQGCEAHTIEEALRTYCRILAPQARVMTMPLVLMDVVDRLFLRRRMARTVALMRLMQRRGEVGDARETHALLGTPSLTLEAWCEMRRRAL